MRLLLLSLFSLILFGLKAQQLVTPTKELNGNFSLEIGNVIFEVNPNHGARIESFRLDGNEFLYVEHRPGIEDMYGSTNWISPQTLWNWPPQPNIDSNPYSGGISGNKIILKSAVTITANGGFNFQIRKTFSGDLSDTSVFITYTIINKTSAAHSFASWEIMRVPTGGLSLFPINGSVSGELAPVFTISGNICWWDYDSTKSVFNKAFADGRDGWLAHVNNDRIMEVKKFADAASAFPSNTEKEIEFWTNTSRDYIEIEKHSAYTVVPAGDSTTLSLKWYLRQVPENIPVKIGGASLLAYIDGIVNPLAIGVQPIISSQTNYNIYPNPSSGQVRISGIERDKNINFRIYDILGKRVFNSFVTADETVNLESFENGIYIYQLQSADKLSSGKLIIRKQ